jgi:hypothetical protein
MLPTMLALMLWRRDEHGNGHGHAHSASQAVTA